LLWIANNTDHKTFYRSLQNTSLNKISIIHPTSNSRKNMLNDRALLISLIFLLFSTLAVSNTPHHVVNLPKFLSPAALSKICHLGTGSSVISEDDVEKPVIGLDLNHFVFPVKGNKSDLDIMESAIYEGSQTERNTIRTTQKQKTKFSTFKVILAGAPASGKGTQCEVIQKNFGLVHLSTGDILRNAVNQHTLLGQMVKPYMDAGHLVPDDLVIELILNRLTEHDCETRGWLLDGFPRTKSQADALRNSGIIPDVFLLLDVPEEILVERVTGRRTDPVTGKVYHMKFNPPENEDVASRLIQRSDDTAEKITVRFGEFQNHIEAIKFSYEEKMVRIDGSLRPSEVTKSVVAELDNAILNKRVCTSDGNLLNSSTDESTAQNLILPELLKVKTFNLETSLPV
jgi:adenylate kinase